MLKRHPFVAAVGCVLALAFVATLAALGASDSSTAPLGLVWFPLYAVGAILLVTLVWLAVRFVRVIRNTAHDFADDDRRV